METVVLTEENCGLYASFLGEDMAENIGRIYYNGLIVTEDGRDDIGAGLVWELKNKDEEADTESAIVFFKALSEEAGKKALDSYTELLKDDAAVRSYFNIPLKGSDVEKAVLKAAGFSVRFMESDRIIVRLSEYDTLPFMKSKEVPASIQPLGKMTMRKFRRAIEKCVLLKRKGLLEDLEELPFSRFDSDISCYSEKDDNVNGLMLYHLLPSGMLSLELMLGMDKDYSKVLVGLMRQSVIAMLEKYEPDTRIVLNRHNEASLSLSEKLFPRGFGIPVYGGSREEG